MMDRIRLSRREFLKGATGVGLGVSALGVLSACAPQPAPAPTQQPQAAAPTAAPQPTAPPPPAKVSLVYWAEPRFQNVPGKEDQTKEIGDYEKLLAQQFMSQNPNVTIDAEALAWEDLSTKVAAAIAAGTPPDLLKDYLGRTSAYANQDLLEPLESAIPKDVYDDFLPSLIQLYTIKNHLSGLPIYFWITGFGGNTLPFKDVGAEDKLPNADGTYPISRFEEALAALAIPDKRWPLAMQVSSEQGDYANLGFFWANGAKLYNNGDYSKTAFNSPESVEALTRLVDWYNKGYIEPGVTTVTGDDMNNMLFKGEAVLGITGPGWMPIMEAAKKDGKVSQDWVPFYSVFPAPEGAKSGGLAAGPTSVVVFKETDDNKRKAAVDFATFLVGPDLQKEYDTVSSQYPTRKSVGNPFEGNAAATDFVTWSQKFGVEDMGLSSPAYAQVRVQLPPQLQAAFLGKKTPEQALADYEKAANEILAKYAKS
jgi:multiple sugar transport system substrate-binding protein